MRDLDSSQDLIDVRDIIARVEELEVEVESLPENEPADELDELATLTALLDDIKGNGGDEQWRGDWYPVTLIRETYFKEAMDDLLEDIGELPRELPCYLKIVVDYDALKMDYTSTEYDGVTYLYR